MGAGVSQGLNCCDRGEGHDGRILRHDRRGIVVGALNERSGGTENHTGVSDRMHHPDEQDGLINGRIVYPSRMVWSGSLAGLLVAKSVDCLTVLTA